MGDFSCVTLFMMIASAICASSLGFVITNGPQDTTVCMNDMAECTCGFDGTSPALTIPDWIIVTRSSDGSIIGNVTIDGEDIVDNKHDGLVWKLGQANTTSSPNSKLVVGSVDETHNQSSYQCVFRLNEFINGSIQSQIVKSGVGTLTVVSPPSIGNIIVDETCTTSLSVSWDTHSHPVCGVLSQLVTISSPTSGAITFPTNDSNFTFTNLNSNTSYEVTITLRYKRVQTRTRSIVIKTPLPHPPPAVFDIATETENNDIKITWKVPEINCSVAEITHYNVTILSKGNPSSKIVTEEVIYLSEILTHQSNISYTVIITAVNSQGSSEPALTTFFGNPSQDDNDGDSESNTTVIVVVVIILILVIIVIVAATIITLVYWKYHTKEGNNNKKASKLPMENSYVESSNTKGDSNLAYAVTGPSSMFAEHRDSKVNNTAETTNSSIHSTENNEDVPTTPPQLPPKLNYAELQMADQLPGTIQKDTRVTYAKTIPA